MADSKRFDTEAFLKRLMSFAQNCRKITNQLIRSDYNRVYSLQLLRSSSSPGANYIEAIEAESRKDFFHRLKICRKETRESVYWLELISDANNTNQELLSLIETQTKEATEIIKIFTKSLFTSRGKDPG